jgi:hypothetical protein
MYCFFISNFMQLYNVSSMITISFLFYYLRSNRTSNFPKKSLSVSSVTSGSLASSKVQNSILKSVPGICEDTIKSTEIKSSPLQDIQIIFPESPSM